MKTQKMKIDNMVKNVKTLTLEEMKKQTEVNFQEKKAREESLVQAYADKKLKSKELIKEARALIKSKSKASGKENKDAAQ